MAKIDIYNEREKIMKDKDYNDVKKISVIIPNYNYSKFIIERIDSVIFQTYPIYEIIILDDCSTDNSVEIIKQKIVEVKEKYNFNNIFLIQNTKNSGNVFKQWQKGFENAKGEYIWIAEADDLCSKKFLEELVKPYYIDNDVVLSYCDSCRIDQNDNIIKKSSSDLYDMCKSGDWKNSYIVSGETEIKKHLSVTNTILNVSSVLWKKKDYTKIFEKAQEYKVAGDWYIYYNVLKEGKIAFNSGSFNYFRKHSNSVSTIINKDREFFEICKIQNEINLIYKLDGDTIKKQLLRRNNMKKLIKKIGNDTNLLRENEKKYIAWVIPIPGKGSGGHRTIIQNVNYLVSKGYVCDIYVPDDGYISQRQMQNKINKYYGKCEANIYVSSRLKSKYDMAIATGNNTVDMVIESDAEHKVYFVQDYEPYFYPMGDDYIAAESTYYRDLKCITIGRWLARKLSYDYAREVNYFNFCADLKKYHKLDEIKKENAICAIYQPNKPRRCDKLLIDALELVSKKRSDLKIYLYGSNVKRKFKFNCTNLNIISVEKCNELYNKCLLGISMSSSNPSRIPFEMMAAGLPVIDLYKENNLYDIPSSAASLVIPTKEAIASEILNLLDEKEKLQNMCKAGINYMKDYPIERGFLEFEKSINDIFSGKFVTEDFVDEKLYTKKCDLNIFDFNKGNDVEKYIYSDSRRLIRRFFRLPRVLLNAINKRVNKEKI